MRFSTAASLAVAISTLSVSAQLSGTPPGQCTSPLKVRKEWRDLNDAGRKAFIDAVKCLGTKPHNSTLAPTGATSGIPPVNTSSSYYDDFVYAHMDSNVKDHFTAIFFPWHRWYLHTFEKALKEMCGFTGTIPFWDWSRDVANIPASPVFNSSVTHGLGTFGTASNNYTVTDGAFGNTIRAYLEPHRVSRRYDHYPFATKTFPFDFTKPNMSAPETFTPAIIHSIVTGSIGNFTDFAYKIDGEWAQGPHNAAHLMIKGDLSNPLFSPNDLIFWLHHGHLDCIWARWQANNTANKDAMSGGLTQDLPHYDQYPVGAPPQVQKTTSLPTVGLSPSVRVIDVMSTKNQYLCYKCAY
ncbi:hypothetical protein FRC12_002735 [Ceratobasidium sp. 428]|nr:hypothetical protein FRC12_002735 [Ceratobasidium sp. 428]